MIYTLTNEDRREMYSERAKELEAEINSLDYWDDTLNQELCQIAGIESEYNNSDSETFEAVVYKAAEIMGINI